MPKPIYAERLSQMMTCAAEAFIACRGYRLTQMSDVAKRMGVSQGTLYNYVESKEALFDLTVRCANEPELIEGYSEFPVPTPEKGALVEYVAEWVGKRSALSPTLKSVLDEGSGASLEGLRTVVREVYRFMYEKRRVVKLVDTCAMDFPELAETWFGDGRLRLLRGIAKYIELGVQEETLKDPGDAFLASRFILEVIASWAMHIHWEPSRMEFDWDKVEDMVVDFSTASFG